MSFLRLGNNTQFQKVYREGRSKANKYLVMYVKKGQSGPSDQSGSSGQSGPSRYGFSVSKKVGNSVVRHRVTRLLRESVGKYDANVDFGCRIIIIARPEITELGLNEICEAIISLYRAHHIWKEKEDEISAP